MMPPRAHAFWGRVTVVESPVDEEETTSGLIVPASALAAGKPDDGELARRGVVQSIDAEIFREGSAERTSAESIAPGTVIYFRNPKRIRSDVLVVDLADILAYET